MTIKQRLLQAANLPKEPEPGPPDPRKPGPQSSTMGAEADARTWVAANATPEDWEAFKKTLVARTAKPKKTGWKYMICGNPKCRGRIRPHPADEEPGQRCVLCNLNGKSPAGIIREMTSQELANYEAWLAEQHRRWLADAPARLERQKVFRELERRRIDAGDYYRRTP